MCSWEDWCQKVFTKSKFLFVTYTPLFLTFGLGTWSDFCPFWRQPLSNRVALPYSQDLAHVSPRGSYFHIPFPCLTQAGNTTLFFCPWRLLPCTVNNLEAEPLLPHLFYLQHLAQLPGLAKQCPREEAVKERLEGIALAWTLGMQHHPFVLVREEFTTTEGTSERMSHFCTIHRSF